MEKVIVAFESEKSCRHVREVLEGAGVASCLVCRSAAEVKRAVNKQGVCAIVCGYKFPDQTAEELFNDLPVSCSMLMIAVQTLLDLCGSRDIFKLAAPVSKGDLTASVRMLLQMGHRMERFVRPRRSGEDQELIRRAKEVLIDRHGMTEGEAHRFLQKRSMDAGAKLTDVAKAVLEGN